MAWSGQASRRHQLILKLEQRRALEGTGAVLHPRRPDGAIPLDMLRISLDQEVLQRPRGGRPNRLVGSIDCP